MAKKWEKWAGNFKGIIVFLFYYTCPTFSR